MTAVLIIAAGAAVSALAVSDSASSSADIQAALEALRDGRLDQAERLAVLAADEPAAGAWRAWLIAADARLRLGRYGPAEAAYTEFIASCTRPAEREYALRQVARCRAGAAGEKPAALPSRKLTVAQLAELAAVDDTPASESSEHFVVTAPNAALAKLVAAEAERALTRICHALLGGQDYPHSVDVRVWTDAAEYRKHAEAAPHWAGGSFSLRPDADGQLRRRIDLTQLDDKRRFDTDAIDRVLPHEMCHLVLAEQFGGAHCPLFLNEGLAMMAEYLVDNGRIKLAGAALGGETKIAVGDLLTSVRCPSEQAGVFYAEAYSLTDYVHGRLSPPQFREMLDHLKAGSPLDEAVQRALCVPPDGEFLTKLAAAWENDAIRQTHFLDAVEDQLSRLP